MVKSQTSSAELSIQGTSISTINTNALAVFFSCIDTPGKSFVLAALMKPSAKTVCSMECNLYLFSVNCIH